MRYGWSLDKEQWQTLINIVSGIEWCHVNLQSSYREEIPERPGVYAICAKVTLRNGVFGKLYNVLYTGQEGVSLRRRFLEHCQRPKSELRMAQECYIMPFEYWYSVVDPSKLDETEGALIDCFGPPANLARKIFTITARLGTAQPAGSTQ